MKVPDGRRKEAATDEGEGGVAEIAIQQRHCSRPDAPLKPVAHHQFETASKPVEESVQVGEIIRVVGIAHDHEAALGGLNSAYEGGAVALVLDMDDAGAGGCGQAL